MKYLSLRVFTVISPSNALLMYSSSLPSSGQNLKHFSLFPSYNLVSLQKYKQAIHRFIMSYLVGMIIIKFKLNWLMGCMIGLREDVWDIILPEHSVEVTNSIALRTLRCYYSSVLTKWTLFSHYYFLRLTFIYEAFMYAESAILPTYLSYTLELSLTKETSLK